MRGIKVLAVVGLAVALVAVWAMAQAQMFNAPANANGIEIEIVPRMEAQTPPKKCTITDASWTQDGKPIGPITQLKGKSFEKSLDIGFRDRFGQFRIDGQPVAGIAKPQNADDVEIGLSSCFVTLFWTQAGQRGNLILQEPITLIRVDNNTAKVSVTLVPPPPLPFNAVKITCNLKATPANPTATATVIGLNIFGNIRSAEGRDFDTTIATASSLTGDEVACKPGQSFTWSLADGTLKNMAPRIGGQITRLTGAKLVYACVPPPPPQNQVKDEVKQGGPPWHFPCSPDEIIVEVEGGPVPTLTEWGLIALAVLLAGSLAFMIRRRLAPRPAGA